MNYSMVRSTILRAPPDKYHYPKPSTHFAVSAPTPAPSRITFIPSKPTPIFKVIPQVYVSQFPIKLDPRISHVINIGRRSNSPDMSRRYLHIPWRGGENLSQHLHDLVIALFILDAFDRDGSVLVHGFVDMTVAVDEVLKVTRYLRQPTALLTLWKGLSDWDCDYGGSMDQFPPYMYDVGIHMGDFLFTETREMKQERLRYLN